MHTISVEIIILNMLPLAFFNKPGLTQPWNTVNQNNTPRSVGNLDFFGLVTNTSTMVDALVELR